jgi:RimJ/RimL family protein N-acetyltransferase
VLRPLRDTDADAYVDAFVADPDLGRWLGIEQDPGPEHVLERVAGAQTAAADGRLIELAILPATEDSFAGAVLVHHIAWEHRRCEIGLWLHPRARRRGLAHNAMVRLVEWLFEDLGMERLEMTTTADNVRLAALARRLGFAHEGTLRSRSIERGRRVDIVQFGLLRAERPNRGDGL